ncbi:MAG: hypothetical protein D6681_00145, partial [Calditrichaeota bacterium]
MSEKMTSQDRNHFLEEVAHYLVLNHLRNSISEHFQWSEVAEIGDPASVTEKRVIVVVGSGASAAAGLPLAKDAAEILRKSSRLSSRTIDAELDRLEMVYRMNRENFETILLALSSTVDEAKRVRDRLHNLFSHRFMPLLCNEILAHMFKHRFIDVIINFNFDELLDQSIADELYPDEYYHILFDGDCPEDTAIFEKPIYIKPHGTAKHKSTLRFTREDYFQMPIDIERVLRKVLSDRPVVVLVIGFGMQSFEFNRLFQQVQSGSQVFYINLEKPVPEPPLPSQLVSEYLIQVEQNGDANEDLNRIMRTLWTRVERKFKDEFNPRFIDRHELVAKVFQTDVTKYNQPEYLLGRTLIELCLFIAKTKGLVNMEVLAKDRSGRYYDHYRESLGSPPDTFDSFYDVCTYLGLKEIGYAREAYSLKDIPTGEKHLIVEIDEFQKCLDGLYQKVFQQLAPIYRQQFDRELFNRTMLKLYQGKEVEIRIEKTPLFEKIFHRHKFITTFTELQLLTHHMMADDNWKYMLVIAETGEWLLEDQYVHQVIEEKKKQKLPIIMALILADLTYEKKLIEMYGDVLRAICSMPWWEHNRHMTVLVDANPFPLSGIYFMRRLRSADITPVYVEGKDVIVLIESFYAYW